MSSLALTQSSGVNVLRWSALIFGIGYGFNRQRTITANHAAAKENADWKHKESLIEKAKAEWAKKSVPQSAKTDSGDLITDPEDKNFNLEAYLQKVAAES